MTYCDGSNDDTSIWTDTKCTIPMANIIALTSLPQGSLIVARVRA